MNPPASLPLPPMLPGLPLVGNAIDFRRDALGLFRKGYQRFGPVFGIRLARNPAVVLVGPDLLRLFFESTDTLLSMGEIYSFLEPILGDKVLFTAPKREYDEQKRVMLPAFHGKKLRSYVGEMTAEVDEWLDTLGPHGTFDLCEVSQQLTMNVVARAILGEPFRRRLGPELASLFKDLAGGLEFVLPTNLPLPRFIRRDRALRKLREILGAVVRERRANPDAHDDFLQALLAASYLDQPTIPDEKVVTFVLGLIFGGRENTSGHLEWALVMLLQHPDALARAVAEVDGVFGPDERPDYDSLRSLPWLEACVKEAERLRPVTHTLLRLAAQDFTAGDYHVPKGWLVVAGIALSQRLPALFRDPERYDPERFSPERDEDKPYHIVGFGGGGHRCWAAAFVNNEMKIMLGMLLRRYELSLVDPAAPAKLNDIGVLRPAPPCMVRYRRRAAVVA
ncbi:MAG: cytochrome P450 [Myxococcaceae bacterium]|nr:MAG: cytochrome P450 [Myxococcaceae bacterium]